MTTAVADLTEAAVIEAALEHFEKRGSFTNEAYFYCGSAPGPDVGATCAIGGVEQVLWQLTGKTVSVMTARAWIKHNMKPESRSALHVLYGKVMLRLNRISRELGMRDSGGDLAETIEGATLGVTHRTGKDRVLRVLRVALEETRA